MVDAVPILIDFHPPYLRGRGGASSLLRLPHGYRSLQESLIDELATLTPHPCVIVPLGAAGVGAFPAPHAPVPGSLEVLSAELLRDPLSRFAPSDILLLVSSRFVPAEPVLEGFLQRTSMNPYAVRHLLASDVSESGTKEFVHLASDGGVRRIQRYFAQTAWPFTAGVMASLIPVASLLAYPQVSIESLEALRKAFSESGIPTVDERSEGHVFDMLDEAGALAMSEQRVLHLSREQKASSDWTRLAATPGASIHSSAQFFGPVIVGQGTVIEADVMVIGPTLIGRGSRIGRGARVAQCLLTEGSIVAADQSVRHRVVGHDASSTSTDEARSPHRRHARPVAPQPPSSDEAERSRRSYGEMKSWVEAPFAALVLILLSPLLAFLAVLVKLTSRGPVFYAANREGLGGRPFSCWKFRSMLVNADALQRTLANEQFADGPQFKMIHDPRLTPIGRRLRAWNLDELPQLANVVMRQMSFVGPRPSPFEENQICVPWREGRLSVRPGITGLWQVCRRDRADGDFHQWIYYDLLYVRHASFLVDLRIFVATILTGGGRHPAGLNRVIPGAVTEPVKAIVSEEFALARAGSPLARAGDWADAPPTRWRAAGMRHSEVLDPR